MTLQMFHLDLFSLCDVSPQETAWVASTPMFFRACQVLQCFGPQRYIPLK